MKGKIGIILGLVALLLIPSVTMNVSAAKTVQQIQAQAEAQLGMQLHLCVQYNITNGYDLLFMPLAMPADMRQAHYFEAYYVSSYINASVTERYLQNSSYVIGPIDIIHVNPLVTGQAISLTGTIQMAALTTFLSFRKYPTNAGFAKVTAYGVFFVVNSKMIYVWDLSYETHDWYEVLVDGLQHWPTIASDHSWGRVDAIGTYYSIFNPTAWWDVWSWVQQYADSYTHWAKNGGYQPH